MSFEKEDDIKDSRVLDGVDLLEAAVKYREQLGWTGTNLAELYAFISFAVAYPNDFSSLVDTYSTINSGCKNFLVVACVLKDLGYSAKGIRLDSGDLAELSKGCRALMKETGEKLGEKYDFSYC
jgi:nicotinate phosphoribosyltransferase